MFFRTSKEEYERECEQTDDEQEELKLIIELSQATNIMLHHPARKEEEKLQDVTTVQTFSGLL